MIKAEVSFYDNRLHCNRCVISESPNRSWDALNCLTGQSLNFKTLEGAIRYCLEQSDANP